MVRPLLLDSLFNVTEILKILMWDAGMDHYFQEKKYMFTPIIEEKLL